MHRIYYIFLFSILAACTSEVVKKESAEPATGVTPGYPEAYIIKEQVNLRSENNKQSDVVSQLNDGDKLYILQNQDGWYRIQAEDGTSGWVRSDLIGPKELCKTCLAKTFSDSVMPAFNGEIFIDKNNPYKIIYLTFAEKYYKSVKALEKHARKTAGAYQEKVYPGEVEVRVLKPGSKNMVTHFTIAAIGLGDLKLPVLKSGRLVSVQRNKQELLLKIHDSGQNRKTSFLENARTISGFYGLSVRKLEIYFYDENDPHPCLFYYLEDKDGEYYKEDCK